MGKNVDSSLLNMAKPDKNEWQAIGDSFKDMYNNYVRTRLSQNEIDLSDLRLGYERATQDDRIRAIKLGTQNLENQVRKSAVDANIAELTEQDKITQEKTKTANDLEILKQSQIKTGFLPNMLKAEINQTNANANNLWMNAKATKQSIFLRDQAFKEQEEAKSIMSDFNEFSLKNPHLKGDDLKNAFFQHLKYMQMAAFNDPLVTDTPTMIMNAQKYLDKQRLFEKHLGYTGQGYRANEDNFNPIPKGGNNGVNSGSDYSNALTQIGQAQKRREEVKNELDEIKVALTKTTPYETTNNKEELLNRKKELEQELTMLGKIPEVEAKDVTQYLTSVLGQSEGIKTYNQIINYAAQKETLKQVAEITHLVNSYGWSSYVLNTAAHLWGIPTTKDAIEFKILSLLNTMQDDNGVKLKQQYENMIGLKPETDIWRQNLERFRNRLELMDDYLNTRVNSITNPHRQKGEIIKKALGYDSSPISNFYKDDNADIKYNPAGANITKFMPEAFGSY